MAIVTLTPASAVSSANATVTGAATAWQALDSSDASWVQFFTGAGQSNVIVGLSTFTLSATQRIAAMQPWVRLDTGAGQTDFFVGLRRSTDGALQLGGHYIVDLGTLTTFADWSRTLSWAGAEWNSTDVGHLQLELIDNNGGTTDPRITWAFVQVDVRNRASVTGVLPSGSNPGNTRTPTVSWTWTDPDAQPQKKAQVKIFTLAQTTVGGFNPATATPVIDSGLRTSAVTSFVSPKLAAGTYVAYVNAAKDFNSQDWFIAAWVAGSSFTITDPLPIPSAISPADGSTVNTDLPQLGCLVNVSALANPPRIKAQWQLAKDSGFTASLRTLTQPDSAYALGGARTLVVDTSNGLTAGAWFLRARELSDVGDIGAWSGAQSITVSHPATTSNLSPAFGNTLDFAGTGSVVFSWQFSDTSPTDFQVGYEIIVERNDTGALVQDTGVVTSGATAVTLVMPSALKDVQLRWKIQITDRDGIAGGYSNYQIFFVRDAPTLTITVPSNGGTSNTPAPPVDWTFAASAGRTQASYRVTYAYQTTPTLLVYDTGVQSGSVLVVTPPSALFNNADAVIVSVIVTDNTGLSKTATSDFTISYTPPAGPDFTVDSGGYDLLGYAAVIWYSNMIPAAQSGPQTVTNASGGTAKATIGPIPVRAGQTYTGLALMQPATSVTPRNVAVLIEWRDANNVVLSTAQSATALENGGAVIQPTLTALAPARADHANLIVEALSTSAGEHHNLTQPQFYTGGYTAETPAVDGTFVAWRVYRKLLTDTNWTLVAEITNPNQVEYDDQAAPAGAPVQFVVAQVATRFGVTVESVYVPLKVTITAAYYWLVHPTDPTLSVRLPNVKTDQFKDEVERAVIKLIGRGRRTEYGTVFGKTGSLTASIRDTPDGVTGTQQFDAIDALKRARSWVYLRNPFGQVWPVSLDDITVNRLAGVGQREFGDITIPYDEVTTS